LSEHGWTKENTLAVAALCAALGILTVGVVGLVFNVGRALPKDGTGDVLVAPATWTVGLVMALSVVLAILSVLTVRTARTQRRRAEAAERAQQEAEQKTDGEARESRQTILEHLDALVEGTATLRETLGELTGNARVADPELIEAVERLVAASTESASSPQQDLDDAVIRHIAAAVQQGVRAELTSVAEGVADAERLRAAVEAGREELEKKEAALEVSRDQLRELESLRHIEEQMRASIPPEESLFFSLEKVLLFKDGHVQIEIACVNRGPSTWALHEAHLDYLSLGNDQALSDPPIKDVSIRKYKQKPRLASRGIHLLEFRGRLRDPSALTPDEWRDVYVGMNSGIAGTVTVGAVTEADNGAEVLAPPDHSVAIRSVGFTAQWHLGAKVMKSDAHW